MEETKKCPFCAEEIKAEAIKCKHCWSELNKAEVWKITWNQLKYKNKNIAWTLAFFLGWLGLHKFYLEKNLLGVIYLVFIWTWIPSILWLIEWIMFWSMKQDEFDKNYNNIIAKSNTDNSKKVNNDIFTTDHKLPFDKSAGFNISSWKWLFIVIISLFIFYYIFEWLINTLSK